MNKLSATGGGDCPELGMTGILKTLDVAAGNSNIIVLTDASAKDYEKKEDVIKKAYSKESPIHFFLNGYCEEEYSYYEEVANMTHGIVVNHIDSLQDFVTFIRKYNCSLFGDDDIHDCKSVGTKTLISTGTKKPTPGNCFTFTASAFTKSIDVLFLSISIGSVITITDPGSIHEIKAQQNIFTHHNEDPLPGIYKICSSRAFKYSLSTKSYLDFFVEYDVNSSRTSIPPPGMLCDCLQNSFMYTVVILCRHSGHSNNIFL